MAEEKSHQERYNNIKNAQYNRMKQLGIILDPLDFDKDIKTKGLLENFAKHVGEGIDWELFPSYTENSAKADLHIDFESPEDLQVLRQLLEDKDFFDRWVHCVRLYIHASEKNIPKNNDIRFMKVVQSFVGMCYVFQSHLCDNNKDIGNVFKDAQFRDLYRGLLQFKYQNDRDTYARTLQCFEDFKKEFEKQIAEEEEVGGQNVIDPNTDDRTPEDGEGLGRQNVINNKQNNESLKKMASKKANHHDILSSIKDMCLSTFYFFASAIVRFCEMIGIKKREDKQAQQDINVAEFNENEISSVKSTNLTNDGENRSF